MIDMIHVHVSKYTILVKVTKSVGYKNRNSGLL